jgi:uncharacterized membrane protein
MKFNNPAKRAVVTRKKILLCLILVSGLLYRSDLVIAQTPVIRAILFYSPSCPHCHQVINQDLPPLLENYQGQLFILAVNTANPDGQALFQAVIDHYQIPTERQGVPMLLVGDEILVGSFEIPNQFPYLIADGLAQSGIDWPNFPQLRTFLVEQNIIQAEEFSGKEEIDSKGENVVQQAQNGSNYNQKDLANLQSMTVSDKFAQDYLGNSFSIVVLVGMILVTGRVGNNICNRPSSITRLPPSIAPILIIIGLSVALYMSYVEITQTEAICGPIGHCNTVQQSPYTYLFGIMPIGVLGVVGYLVIALTWLVGKFGPRHWRKRSMYSFFALTIIGTLFSIYLTFLEPFVIGASCAWCLTSAVVMTLLMLYSQGHTLGFEDH